MKELTYEEVYKEWGNSRYKRINYKTRQLVIKAQWRAKDNKVFYIGRFYERDFNRKLHDSSIESIHYNKVVSRFQKFVDEYCTEWQARPSFQYKGYRILINQEKDSEFYLGYVHFHKNSTFKHIADTREEVERCCKNRIDRVVYEKEKVSNFKQDFNKVTSVLANGARKQKIQELEQLLARISTQLEELKKEKDILTYKGVVLELLDDPIYCKGILRSVDNPSPFVENSKEDLKKSFENYVDRLEASYNLYRKLTGKEK